jgi:hypothetical protein
VAIRTTRRFDIAARAARAAMDDGEIVGQIGEGAFGRVMLARTTAGARRARGDG